MTTDWQKQGKTNKRKGGEFEREVRTWLREDGWIVDKFSSNIELSFDFKDDSVIGGEFVTAKAKFNAFRRVMGIGTGFPDFLCFRPKAEGEDYELMFVECKLNGRLSREEKEKMAWMESEGHCCWVAGRDENGNIELNKPKKAKEKKKAVEDGE